MGLLDRALNFAQRAYNYVVGNDNESEAAKKKAQKTTKTSQTKASQNVTKPIKPANPNSVLNPEEKTVGTVVDTLEKTQTSKTNEAKLKTSEKVNKSKTAVPMQSKVKLSGKKLTDTKLSVDKRVEQLKSDIQNKCKKFGISYQEVESEILSQMQFSFEEFKNMSADEQLAVLLSIDGALGLYIVKTSKKQIHKSVDTAAVIGQTARNIIKAQESGGVDTIEEFTDGVGNINDELDGKINSKTTDDEYAEILADSRKKFKASLELKRNAEIKKCKGDEEKIAEVNAKFDAKLQAFEAQRQVDFAAAQGPKKAHLSVYLRAGNDFADAHAIPLSIYAGENRTVVADSFTHEFEMDAKRRYYEAGDSISSDEYARAVLYATQYMSQQALTQFQQDAFEFRRKVENGEIDAPYMTSEDFSKETAAIGVGIVNNKNLNSVEKAELLDKWDKNAMQFSDYCKVKEEFNNSAAISVAVNPNSEQGFTNVKKILIEKYNNNIEQFPKAWEKRNNQKPEIKTKATEATLKSELKTKSISEIKSCYNNSMQEIAKIILDNDTEYKNRIDEVIDYLNRFSGTEIGLKIAGCTTCTISKVIQAFPEKAEDILDIVAPTMCFTGKQAVEHIVNEGKGHEAA